MFEKKVSYTRAEVHAQVGGHLELALPNFGGRVVAACLELAYHPDAPDIILVGTGSGIEHAANLLAAQPGPVPMFLKRGIDEWEYVGEYTIDRASREADELAAQALRSGRDDITRVIHMAPASR